MERNLNRHIEIGRIGEDIAGLIIKKKGYREIERNYRKTFGEIDLVAKDKNGELVFIEVKTLINKNVYQIKPEDNLTRGKLEKLKKICEWFVNQNEKLIDEEKGWRIDLLAISLDWERKTYSYRHYENIGE